MKLLIITQKLDINDPILGFFHSWLEVFSKNCERLTIICLEKGEYHLPENVTVHSLGKERGVSRFRYVLNFYYQILKERNNYDGVFVHMNPEYAILGFPVWKILGKKIALWYTHKSVDLKLRIAEKLTDKIFTASKESFRLSSRKVEVVGHGIDIKPFEFLRSDFSGLRLLTVGRISPAKDIRTLILGVLDLKNKIGDTDLTFDIVGGYATEDDKVYEKEMRKLVKESGLSSIVNFLGEKKYSDLPEIYREHNIFLHASRTGSMDKVVLEAIASGLTVFTSSESYQDFHGGIYRFKAGDSADLARIIELVISGNKWLNNQKAKDFISRHYGLDALVKKITAFFSL